MHTQNQSPQDSAVLSTPQRCAEPGPSLAGWRWEVTEGEGRAAAGPVPPGRRPQRIKALPESPALSDKTPPPRQKAKCRKVLEGGGCIHEARRRLQSRGWQASVKGAGGEPSGVGSGQEQAQILLWAPPTPKLAMQQTLPAYFAE